MMVETIINCLIVYRFQNTEINIPMNEKMPI